MGTLRFLVLCWLASLYVVGVDTAVAQTWPAARPVTMVVPFPPGPALDLVARLVGGKISDALGQTVVVENRSGANGTIGSSLVARATPDGYTLLAATAGTHVTAVHLMKHLPYDPLKDFAPIVAAVEPVTCLAVHSAVPVDTVEELIAYARSHPDELSYGSSGLGSVFHMMGELFNQTAGVRIKHVPYRGVAPAMQDVISGHIPMVFISVSNAIPAMQTGRVKILAVLEPTRYPKLSQVRSMSEIVSAFQKPSSWFGFFGPAGLPREIATRLNIEMVKSLNASDVRGKLEDNGMTVIGGTPEQFGALMQDGIVRYGAIIKATGIQAE
jgi:tripartite-type tricarboxylate transporter receptor subunit TctC